MKTTIEIKGYMIEVEEKDGNIFVKALSGDEVIEEFEINLEGDEDDIERSEDDIDSDTDDDNENEIKDFDDFAQEDDFDDSNDIENNAGNNNKPISKNVNDNINDNINKEDDENDDDNDEEDEDNNMKQKESEVKLESFQTFISKLKNKRS